MRLGLGRELKGWQRFRTGVDHQGLVARGQDDVRGHKSGWHQAARLGDFPMPSCSLGILMGKADDWNPQGWERQGEGVWESSMPVRMNDVANPGQVHGGRKSSQGRS